MRARVARYESYSEFSVINYRNRDVWGNNGDNGCNNDERTQSTLVETERSSSSGNYRKINSTARQKDA
jgi:hypothetical protein